MSSLILAAAFVPDGDQLPVLRLRSEGFFFVPGCERCITRKGDGRDRAEDCGTGHGEAAH